MQGSDWNSNLAEEELGFSVIVKEPKDGDRLRRGEKLTDSLFTIEVVEGEYEGSNEEFEDAESEPLVEDEARMVGIAEETRDVPRQSCVLETPEDVTDHAVWAYKKVAQKVRPVPGVLPEEFRIV